MTRPAQTSLSSYARAVERSWSACLERPVILSPRDWSLIRDWHARGVPLQIIREAIDALSEGRRSSPPRGLGAIARSVDESHAAIADGRLRPPRPSEAPAESVSATAPATVLFSTWRAYLNAHDCDEDRVAALLRHLLQRHEAGVPAEELDAALDEGLGAAVPSGLLNEAESEVEARLRPFRDRMPGDALDATRRRAIVDRLRLRLGLGRVATV